MLIHGLHGSQEGVDYPMDGLDADYTALEGLRLLTFVQTAMVCFIFDLYQPREMI